ncbi:hypothetical protein MVEN_02614900 [Mycena venus]|uniref:DUF6535 domain-containing protein n=1 Tax=Mycena venus TaxID=2733690 RepID=A0A8H6WPU4_9AGAR|nr:hypothetical protein MVEN_02614900 [Mycena venus]
MAVPAIRDPAVHAPLSDYKLSEALQNLGKAIEGFGPQAAVVDKKNKFWNAYKLVAEEYDKEFQEKYKTDLDTGLLFAGLFSAVSSAFIIQIQPDIQSKSISLVVVTQSLLYISLFSTLLVAMLAVLGKQWLMYYSAAGERGTTEARGLIRQRKFDSLRNWKFNVVMEMFPVLLQIALFLFSAALAVYLWSIQRIIATIVLVLTTSGVLLYLLLAVSAIISVDSPFQTPFAPFLLQVAKLFSHRIFPSLGQLSRRVWSKCSIHTQVHILPYFSTSLRQTAVSRSSSMRDLGTEPKGNLFEDDLPVPSYEVAAVSWLLETSSDPGVIGIAAELAVDLQWPLGLDLAAQMTRLRDTFLGCFHSTYKWHHFRLKGVKEGMAECAIQCGRAYCSLRMVHEPARLQECFGAFPVYQDGDIQPPELVDVIQILAGSPHLLLNPDSKLSLATRWALHVLPSVGLNVGTKLTGYLDLFKHNNIPHLDVLCFTDYLFCLNAGLVPMSIHDMAWVDKSKFLDTLFNLLFSTLHSGIETGATSMEIVAKIVNTTVELATKPEPNQAITGSGGTSTEQLEVKKPLRPQLISRCPIHIVLSAVKLAVDADFSDLGDFLAGGKPDDGVQWVYMALKYLSSTNGVDEWDISTVSAVEGLLQALMYYHDALTNEIPPLESLEVILRALEMEGTISHAAFLVLYLSRAHWFRDSSLRNVMQRPHLWSRLGCIALPGSYQFGRCIYQLSLCGYR